MPTTKKTAKKAAAKSGALRVTTARDGFRRAGRAWHGTTDVPAGELSAAQIKALRADPMFEVGEPT